MAIHLQNLRFDYDGEILFQDINLSVATGEWICILGPSGVGKSTLLKLCAGLLKPHRNDHSPLPAPRADIAYMGQDDLLLPWLTVAENINLANRLRFARNDELERVDQLVRQVGMTGSGALMPGQLSGGMRQRTALARTLIQNKPVILLDEPFSALDAITRHELQGLAAEALNGKTVIMVTHDPMEAIRLSHRIVILNDKPARFCQEFQPRGLPPRDLSQADTSELYSHIMNGLVH